MFFVLEILDLQTTSRPAQSHPLKIEFAESEAAVSKRMPPVSIGNVLSFNLWKFLRTGHFM